MCFRFLTSIPPQEIVLLLSCKKTTFETPPCSPTVFVSLNVGPSLFSLLNTHCSHCQRKLRPSSKSTSVIESTSTCQSSIKFFFHFPFPFFSFFSTFTLISLSFSPFFLPSHIISLTLLLYGRKYCFWMR